MIHNTFTVAGLSAITFAAWQVNPALAWLVGGVQLLAVGVGGAVVNHRKKLEAKANT